MREGNDGVEAVAEFRREQPVDRLEIVAWISRAIGRAPMVSS